MTADPLDLDVLVVGGGPVGACLAALLIRRSRYRAARIGLIERQRPRAAVPGEPVDLRVSAFSRASERILAAADAWADIAAGRISPYERMHVWHASEPFAGGAGLTFDAAEVSEPNLGYIIENRAVQHALLAALERGGGRILSGPVTDLTFERNHVAVRVGEQDARARLVVGADGGRSLVRELAGLPVEAKSYGQSAVVCVVATARAHARTAWQRFLGTGTLAFLPLADGSSSIVWSVPSEEAERLRAAPAEQFASELETASDHALGHVSLVSERATFALQQAAAQRYVIERCALAGDAAHVVHPLAGQGVNLGLLDAAALADVLNVAREQREDPGALRMLRRYERWRKSENQLMSFGLDALNRLLATGTGPFSRLAQRGLGIIDHSGAAKRAFIERALGLAGELPTAARPAARPAGEASTAAVS
jgi:2-octaprenylphenol hydroxylase